MSLRRISVACALVVLVSVAIVQIRNHDSSPAKGVSSAPANSIAKSATAAPVHSAPGLPPVSSATPERKDLDGQPALEAPAFAELSTAERPPLGNKLGLPGVKPEAEPKIVLEILNAYRRILGAYPAGENNSQFVNALLGANKQKLPFIAGDHPRINSSGEIVDAWGTPFYFHQISRNSIEVRSAGADHLMYTDDDIVAGRHSVLAQPIANSQD